MAGILFDARVIRPGMTGIGTYARSLLRALPADQTRIGIVLSKNSPYAKDFAGFRIHFTRIEPDSHPLTEAFEQIVVPWICRRFGYTSFVSFGGPIPAFRPGFKAYAFVYDLAFLRIKGSHNLKYSLLLQFNLWIARRFATRILTISETVRGQIVSMLKISAPRTGVVYPADSRLNETEPRVVGVNDRPYFLAVSLTNPRKNITGILEGFKKFKLDTGGTQRLVMTGNENLIQDAVGAKSHPDVVNLGFVSEGELRFLYEHAEALIYASLDEGFGIPLLDAYRSGCPVVCSDIAVFREVMGTNARYFEPKSPDSIAKCLAVQSREGAMSRGDSAPDRFSWETSAVTLLELLKTPPETFNPAP